MVRNGESKAAAAQHSVKARIAQDTHNALVLWVQTQAPVTQRAPSSRAQRDLHKERVPCSRCITGCAGRIFGSACWAVRGRRASAATTCRQAACVTIACNALVALGVHGRADACCGGALGAGAAWHTGACCIGFVGGVVVCALRALHHNAPVSSIACCDAAVCQRRPCASLQRGPPNGAGSAGRVGVAGIVKPHGAGVCEAAAVAPAWRRDAGCLADEAAPAGAVVTPPGRAVGVQRRVVGGHEACRARPTHGAQQAAAAAAQQEQCR